MSSAPAAQVTSPGGTVTAAAPTLDTDATPKSVKTTASGSVTQLPPAADKHPMAATYPPHEDWDVSIIWHNVYAHSDFSTIRSESRGPVERIMVDFGRIVASGVFEQVLAVNASKYLFCVTVACTKNMDEGVRDQIFSMT